MEAAMTETAASEPTILSADELHRFLLLVHKIQSRARRKFIQGLLRMEETELYSLIGSPDIYVYSRKHFNLGRTATAEALRAAKALGYLPRTLEALDAGTLAYSRVLEITKVATAATEAAWIELAQKKSFSFLRSEVRDAKQSGRDHPRKDGHGLPAIKVKIIFELAPEEREITEKALEKVRRELSASLGGKPVDAKTAFLFLMERTLETEPGEAPAGRHEGSEPVYSILYHHCPGCRRSHVATADGLEEVEPGVVERVEGEAERVEIDPAQETALDAAPSGPVEIDPPNTPQLTRRVLLRDLLRCSNPYCGRTCGLHAHHIRWRCHGGKTALSNETAVCFRCHALIHQRLLAVTVEPDGSLRWVARGDALDFALEAEDLSALSSTAVPSRYVDASVRPTKGGVTSPPEALADLEALVGGLERLGFSRREARERLLEAHRRLSEGGKTPTEEDVVREALRRSVPRSARAAPAA